MPANVNEGNFALEESGVRGYAWDADRMVRQRVVRGRSHRPGCAASIVPRPTKFIAATLADAIPRHESSRQRRVSAGETTRFLVVTRNETPLVMRFTCAARDRRGGGDR